MKGNFENLVNLAREIERQDKEKEALQTIVWESA